MGRRKQPVREHRHGQRLNVIRYHVIAPIERRECTARTDQLQRRPGGRAEPQTGMGPSRGHEVDRILTDRFGYVHVLHRMDQGAYPGGIDNRSERAQRRGG